MWWNLLGWLLICNGMCAAGAAFINRLHGYSLPDRFVAYSHKINGVMLLLTGAGVSLICLVAAVTLFPVTSWNDIPLLWQGLLGFSAVSTGIFWIGVVRHHLRPTPSQQQSVHKIRRQIDQEAGESLAGEGPFDWMHCLPGNQIFQLEIVDRCLELQTLPAAWDGLTILHFSDVHFVGTVKRQYFERVFEHAQNLQPDLICFTGDLLDDLELLDWLPTTLGRLHAPLGRYFVLGNHDQQLDWNLIRDRLTTLGWTDLSRNTQFLERGGQKISLCGSEFPWGESSLTCDPPADPDHFRILLSHTPDDIPRARRANSDLMLSGHVHGGQIRLPLIGPIYCPSRFGCYYAEGLFWESPTLLHVTRGVAGRQPLRWGCPPEITRLKLRSVLSSESPNLH